MQKKSNNFKFIIIFLFMVCFAVSCKKKDDSSSGIDSIWTGQGSTTYLYVATGACYGAGNTTYTSTTASNLIYRINLSTGLIDGTMPTIDFSGLGFSSGDSPVGITDGTDGSSFYSLVENATAGSRRIIRFSKSTGSAISIPLNNTTILSNPLNYLLRVADGSYLISKGIALEKVNALFQRLNPTGVVPWVSAPTPATCATTNNRITAGIALQNNKVLYTHASTAANTSNKTVIVSSTGYATTTDCLNAQAAPAGNPYPTHGIYIPMTASTGQVLVSYGYNATTSLMNSIYSYDLDETSNTFSAPIKSYEDSSVLYAIPAMAYDAVNSTLYVASAISTATTVAGYKIEKFTYSTSTKTLTRVANGGLPFTFAIPSSQLKCISQMMITN